MFYRSLVLAFLTMFLSACNFTGTGEKGPFVAGSTVTASSLNKHAMPKSAGVVSSYVVGNSGRYSLDSIRWKGWSQVQISGRFFNEFTNTNSTDSFTLDAITKKDRRFDTANVHLFSHLAAARIRQLVANGKKRRRAWGKAQLEMKQTFDLKGVRNSIHRGVEQLSLQKGTGRFRKANAVLLLFTGSFLATGGDVETLDALAADFADDGQFNGAGQSAFNAIASMAATDGLLTTLSKNLKSHGARNPPNNGDMPNLPSWVNQAPADTTPPTITIEGSNPVEIDAGTEYVDAGASATDNIDAVVMVKSVSNVDSNTAGNYEVVYTAVDSSNNSATATRFVNVNPVVPVDTTPPVITLLGDNPDTAFISYDEVPEPYDDPGVTVTDDQDAPVTYTIIGTVDRGTLGHYKLIYNATDDALNIAEPVERFVDVIPLPNQAPVAESDNISIDEDSTTNAITLSGSDANVNDTLTFRITVQPTHGELTGDAPNVNYKPDADYFGSDSFQFVVNDATVDSQPATISITINDVAEPNQIPVANGQSISVDENSSNNQITLTGTDVDSNDSDLTYTITTQPTHGTLTGTAPNVVYTPDADYADSDSFEFTVNDGEDSSVAAVVSITIDEVNDITLVPVSGTIRQTDGSPISDVELAVFKDNILQVQPPVTSNTQGRYSLSLESGLSYTLVVNHDGYATQITSIDTLPATTGINVDITLATVGPNQNFDGTRNITITGNYGTSAEITKNSFVDSNNVPVTDIIALSITTLDTSTQAGKSTFPGSFSGVFEGEAVAESMYVLGVAEFKYINTVTNEVVNLAPLTTAKVTIPLFNLAKPDGTPLVIGEVVPLLSLDEVTGTWKQEASGTVVELASSPTGLAVSGDVPHFSWWSMAFGKKPNASSNAFANITVTGNYASNNVLIKARTNADVAYDEVVASISMGGSKSITFPGWSNTTTCFWAEVLVNEYLVSSPEECVSPTPGSAHNISLTFSDSSTFDINTQYNITAILGDPAPFLIISPFSNETSVSYTITSGALPAGVTLVSSSPQSTTVTGTPTEAGQFNAEITATNSSGVTQTTNLVYSVIDASVSPYFYVGTEANTVPNTFGGYETAYNTYTPSRGSITLNAFGKTNISLNIASLNIGSTASTWKVTSPYVGIGDEGTVLDSGVIVTAASAGVTISNLGILSINKPASTTSLHFRLDASNSQGSDTIEVDLVFDRTSIAYKEYWTPPRINHLVGSSGLIWLNTRSVRSKPKSWDDANSYCSSLDLDGYSSWRLPTFNELVTIYEPTVLGGYSYSVWDPYDNNSVEQHWTSMENGSDHATLFYYAHYNQTYYSQAISKLDFKGVRCVTN